LASPRGLRGLAVLATTLSLMAVFLPVAFMSGDWTPLAPDTLRPHAPGP